MSKKAILLLIAVALLIGVAVLVWQKQISQVQNPSKLQRDKEETQTTESTDWKAYRSEKYGFQFEYPKNWIADEVIDVPVLFLKSNSFQPVLLGYDAENKALFSRGEIRVDILDNNRNLSIKERYLENDDITRLYFADEKKRYQETKINDHEAIIFEAFSENNPNWKIDVKHKISILRLGNKIVSFDYIYTGSSDEGIEHVLSEVMSSVTLLR